MTGAVPLGCNSNWAENGRFRPVGHRPRRRVGSRADLPHFLHFSGQGRLRGKRMRSSPTDEAAIFEQIHDLLQQQQGKRRAMAGAAAGSPAPRVDSRTARRRPYHCAQLIAPLRGPTPPAQGDFELVQCRDISPGGFAYFTDQRPLAERVVVALGLAPFTFFVAQIVRVQEAEPGSEAALLVGCRFLHRLEPTAY